MKGQIIKNVYELLNFYNHRYKSKKNGMKRLIDILTHTIVFLITHRKLLKTISPIELSIIVVGVNVVKSCRHERFCFVI